MPVVKISCSGFHLPLVYKNSLCLGCWSCRSWKSPEASFNVYDAALTTTDEIVRIDPRRIGNDYNPRWVGFLKTQKDWQCSVWSFFGRGKMVVIKGVYGSSWMMVKVDVGICGNSPRVVWSAMTNL